jgi:hypothetical protein
MLTYKGALFASERMLVKKAQSSHLFRWCCESVSETKPGPYFRLMVHTLQFRDSWKLPV